MKKEKMLRAMSLAEDIYVEEADPKKGALGRLRKQRILRWSILAACFCLVFTVFNVWMFKPFDTELPDVSDYADSEYYSIIQKLNAATHRPSVYKNNFDKLVSKLSNLFLYAKEDGANAPTSGADNMPASYQETTDNQVEGVIEGDRIKRSDRYIYYLNGTALTVYSIEGESSKEVGSYTFEAKEIKQGSYSHEWEFYLSEDCTTVNAILSYYDETDGACVSVVSLDVTDPTRIVKKKEITVTGSYLSSRTVDGSLLLLSQFAVSGRPSFSDETTFVPQVDYGDGKESIPASGIISPEELSNTRYTVILKLDDKTLEAQGSAAFLSYSQEVYVSLDAIYATRAYTQRTDGENGHVTVKQVTDISVLAYGGDALEYRGSITVDGYVKDQYSLDQYDGMLRVVTTTETSRYEESRNLENETVAISSASRSTSANLYCVDLATLQIRSQEIGFAPEGETVRSVRFDREMAYVCTAIQVTDPVFFFDLSDPDHITYRETGTVEGFSTSLVNFGDGYLLGIGVGASGDLKLEIYEETEDGVESVCKYEVSRGSYSENYKSYFIDRERGLVGLGVTTYRYTYGQGSSDWEDSYILLHFDGYQLRLILQEPIGGNNDYKRAVLIDGYFYMFGEDAFAVREVTLATGKSGCFSRLLFWKKACKALQNLI